MSRIVPTTPDNSLTPSFSSVASANGFSSGDLVYYKDSNFGAIPANAVATGSFPITANVPLGSSSYNNYSQMATNSATVPNGSINGRSESAAVLTNGNIVIVYTSARGGSSKIYFKIIDQNGAQVVAPTEIPISNNIYDGLATVCALSGGGFVASWRGYGSNYNLFYAIYTNAGVVVTAATEDANLPNPSAINVQAFAAGGFVIAANCNNGNGNYVYRRYDSTGTPVAAAANVGLSSASSAFPIFTTVFADDSYAIYVCNTNTIAAFRYTSAGVLVSPYGINPSDYNGSGQWCVTKLSNNNALIAYSSNSSNAQRAYVFDPATNTVTLLGFIGDNRSNQYTVDVKGIAGGGFVNIYSYSNNSCCAAYAIYNNSGTKISAGTLLIPGMPSNYLMSYAKFTVVETTNYFTIFYTGIQAGNTQTGTGYVQVNKTSPYALRAINATNLTLATASAAVNGYARSASTPNSASFLAATTQTLSVSTTASSGSTYQLAPATVVLKSIIWQSMTIMQDGRFVIAYSYGGGSPGVDFTVFNSDGSVYTSATVATGSSYQGRVNCTCLVNGKLVVSYSTSSYVYFKVYSSTYSLLTSFDTSSSFGGFNGPNGTAAGTQGHSICPIDSSTFAVGFVTGSTPYFAIYNDAGTLVNYYGSPYGGLGAYDIAIASNGSGSIGLSYYSSSYGTSYVEFWVRLDAISWTYNTRTGMSSGGGYNVGSTMVMSPNGTCARFVTNGSTKYFNRTDVGNSISVSYGSWPSANVYGMCVGPTGEPVMFIADGTYGYYGYYGYSPQTSTSSGSTAYTYGSTLVLPVNPSTSSGAGSCPAIVNVYGDIYAISYITTAGYLAMGLISTSSATYSLPITAGVTASLPALYPSPSNGYYLAGISASDCAAGGTGVIQTNGAATLNSQYPAGTTSQAFDFTTNTLSGVKGTIAGRNVVLKGS
jgi:hypothetical protein